jgi:hypothetical protein
VRRTGNAHHVEATSARIDIEQADIRRRQRQTVATRPD